MKCAIYAHEIVKLCSKMCLTVPGSDELAVLDKSLDAVGCSLSLDSLTET